MVNGNAPPAGRQEQIIHLTVNRLFEHQRSEISDETERHSRYTDNLVNNCNLLFFPLMSLVTTSNQA